MYKPAYIELHKRGEIKKRIEIARNFLKNCSLCPRLCGVDRFTENKGFCHSGFYPIVSSFTAHRGEEPLISGTNGAGNIFFGNCNLACVYCQNYEISQNWLRECKNQISFEQLADIMIHLQNKECHNIGLVSPTHFTYQILEALDIAISRGLKIPIIYNSNGYDSVEVLKLLEGIIDIYLPDFKYGLNEDAKEYSKVNNYFDFASMAIKEMFRQVGSDLIIEDGVLKRGLIIRHLVLPNNLAESEKIFKFISEELSDEVYISLMSQYYPTNKASQYILLNRTLRFSEYQKAINLLEKYNLKNGWIQHLESYDYYRPRFLESRENPFEL